MKTSSLNLLPASSFGVDVIGTPQKAASYYSRGDSLQTLSWYLTEFVGTITIEATLDTDMNSANYVTIHDLVITSATTENDFINLVGNYTWIKASVTEFTAGSVLKITVGY